MYFIGSDPDILKFESPLHLCFIKKGNRYILFNSLAYRKDKSNQTISDRNRHDG